MVNFCALVVAASAVLGQVQNPSPAYEHLKALKPFIGTWEYNGIAQDDIGGVKKGQPLRMTFSFGWILNNGAVRWEWSLYSGDKLLVSGVEQIGWNGKEKTIVSYMVGSDGGTDIGKWKVSDGKVVDKFIGANLDGTEFRGTVLMSVLDDNTMTWQNIGYSVGAASARDTAVYKYKRIMASTTSAAVEKAEVPK